MIELLFCEAEVSYTKMEVRSTEKCGSDATATAVTTSTDETRANVNLDLSRTTVNDDTKPPLTRDESK